MALRLASSADQARQLAPWPILMMRRFSFLDDAPVLIEFRSDADEVIDVFWNWADAPEDTRLVWTPDALLAIDTPERSGYLIDEVYFVTVWIRRGGNDFLQLLEETALSEPWAIQPIENEPDPAAFLSSAIKWGYRPTCTGRHPPVT